MSQPRAVSPFAYDLLRPLPHALKISRITHGLGVANVGYLPKRRGMYILAVVICFHHCLQQLFVIREKAVIGPYHARANDDSMEWRRGKRGSGGRPLERVPSDDPKNKLLRCIQLPQRPNDPVRPGQPSGG